MVKGTLHGPEVFLLVLGVLVSGVSTAQEARPGSAGPEVLIGPVSAALAPDLGERVETLRARPGVRDVSVAEFHPATLTDGATVIVDLGKPGTRAVRLTVESAAGRDARVVSLSGVESAIRGDLVVTGRAVIGRLYADDAVFLLQSAAPNVVAMIWVDRERYEPWKEYAQRGPRVGGVVPTCCGTPVVRVLVAYGRGVAAALRNPFGCPAVSSIEADQELQAEVRDEITRWIDGANETFSKSLADVRLELAHAYPAEWDADCFPDSLACEGAGQVLAAVRSPGDGRLDEIHGLMDLYQADIAVLLTNTVCSGEAFVGATRDTAFAVVQWLNAWSEYGFAHEVGHLFGAGHALVDPNHHGFTPYAHGFCDTGHKIRTIMTRECGHPNAKLMPYWSNPAICYEDIALGSCAENNARVIDENACRLASFRSPSDSLGTGWLPAPNPPGP